MENLDRSLKFDLYGITESLGIEKQREILAKHWSASCESYDGDIFFLNGKFISTYNEYFDLPDNLLEEFNITIETINNNNDLKFLAWHLHQILFSYNDGENTKKLVSDWPRLEKAMGELSDMFGAVILASGIRNTLKFYKEKGIPETIAKDTLDDFLRWINAHYRRTGRWGFSEYGWLHLHFTGRLFRLGRLQFEPYKFKDKIIVYKNKSNGKTLVLSRENVKYRRDGQIDGTCSVFDLDGAWVSQYGKKDGKIQGNPILENASCGKETVEIYENEWDVVLEENDTVLNVHIHEGSKLDHELCSMSYKEALEFFKKYFPGIPFKGFTCFSWLLDIQLSNVLDNNSNIVKFLNDYFQYPVYSPREAQMYERVFGKYTENVEELPENTFLQKSIKEYIKKGNFMRNGAGFILID